MPLSTKEKRRYFPDTKVSTWPTSNVVPGNKGLRKSAKMVNTRHAQLYANEMAGLYGWGHDKKATKNLTKAGLIKYLMPNGGGRSRHNS